MADILKGLGGAVGPIIFAWIFPSAIALSVVYSIVLTRFGYATAWGLDGLAPTDLALALAVAATALGLAMNALSTPLYRVLEGYAWPAALRRWGTERQLRRRRAIAQRVTSADGALDRALLSEGLRRFPVDEQQTAPTGLGNALRAFETYGVDRYRLDSQTFWTELVAVVPDSLRTELAGARASVDFFVALVYLSGGVGFVCLVAGARAGDPGLAIAGLLGLLLVPVCYRAAITSSTYWDATVRAVVNLGRRPLAQGLGLRIPEAIAGEREMWELVAAFDFYGFDEQWAGNLDAFRSNDSSTASARERTNRNR